MENRKWHCIHVDYEDDKEEEEKEEEKGKGTHKDGKIFSLAPRYSHFYQKEKIMKILTVTETCWHLHGQEETGNQQGAHVRTHMSMYE